MTAVDESDDDDADQQETSACQGDDLPKETENPARKAEKEVTAVNVTSLASYNIKQEVY